MFIDISTLLLLCRTDKDHYIYQDCVTRRVLLSSREVDVALGVTMKDVHTGEDVTVFAQVRPASQTPITLTDKQ